jgi:hypothetical protein
MVTTVVSTVVQIWRALISKFIVYYDGMVSVETTNIMQNWRKSNFKFPVLCP